MKNNICSKTLSGKHHFNHKHNVYNDGSAKLGQQKDYEEPKCLLCGVVDDIHVNQNLKCCEEWSIEYQKLQMEHEEKLKRQQLMEDRLDQQPWLIKHFGRGM